MLDIYTLYFDGSCWPNPGGKAGYGYALYKNGQELITGHGIVGNGSKMSNNVAEYYALYMGLCEFLAIQELGKCFLNIYGDSNLVIKQMQKRWKVKHGLYKPFYDKTKTVCKLARERGAELRFEWIPRENNTICDDLSKLHAKEKI